MKTPSEVEQHLALQYKAWAAALYPQGRVAPDARLDIRYDDGTSGYDYKNDVIVIFIPDGNLPDFESRCGNVSIVPDKWKLSVSEIELLHEMMHERQFKERLPASDDGRALLAKFPRQFSGPGHDEVFYSAIALSAPLLGTEPETLVRNL